VDEPLPAATTQLPVQAASSQPSQDNATSSSEYDSDALSAAVSSLRIDAGLPRPKFVTAHIVDDRDEFAGITALPPMPARPIMTASLKTNKIPGHDSAAGQPSAQAVTKQAPPEKTLTKDDAITATTAKFGKMSLGSASSASAPTPVSAVTAPLRSTSSLDDNPFLTLNIQKAVQRLGSQHTAPKTALKTEPAEPEEDHTEQLYFKNYAKPAARNTARKLTNLFVTLHPITTNDI